MSFRSSMLNYLAQRDRGWMLSLFAAVCLVYLPFLGNPFVFDDLNFFNGVTPEVYAHALFQFDLRWLPYASLGWTAAVFSDAAPHFFHLGNALLHTANVILLFYLLRLVSGVALAGHERPKSLVWGAWMGAMAFALHPVAVYAVGYVIQRSILMATLFTLLMQLAYLHGLLTGRKHWLALAIFAYFAACFSKEHSVLAPAILAALTILFRTKILASRAALWAAWCVFFCIGALVVLRARGVFGSPYEVAAMAMFEQQGVTESVPRLHLLSILTQAGLFFKYLGLWLFPNPAWMSVDMREPIAASIGEWRNWMGVVAFLAYGLAAIRLLLYGGATGLIGFALLYPWLQFWLEFSSIRIQEIFVLYRSYLWLPGLMVFIPLLLARYPGRKPAFAAGLIILLLVPLSVNRLRVFADDYRLWDDAAKLLRSGEEPLASRIYYNRARAAANAGIWEAAVSDYEKAIARNIKDDPIIRYNLGMAYFKTKRYQDALVQFDKAVALNPEYARAYFDMGLTLKMLNQHELGTKQLRKSCELNYMFACIVLPPGK